MRNLYTLGADDFFWICWHFIDVGSVFALLLRLVLALRASAMRACFGVSMRE